MSHRCPWSESDPHNREYHDKLWGVPVYDDRVLLEMLILEGAQAGLSWTTILKKWPNYRIAFDNFDPEKIACYDERKITALMNDPGIVRNRLKIQGTVLNARAWLEIMNEAGSTTTIGANREPLADQAGKRGGFSTWIWSFVDGKPRHSCRKALSEIPTHTPESDLMSKNLKKRGFKFVGTTICYAFMQAVGMVNDHLVDCFRYKEILGAQKQEARRPASDKRKA